MHSRAPRLAPTDTRAEQRRETWLLALLSLLLLTQCALRPTPSRPYDMEHPAPAQHERPDRVHQLVNQIRREYQQEPLPAGRQLLVLEAPTMTAEHAEHFRQQWHRQLQGLGSHQRLVITTQDPDEYQALLPDPLAEVLSLQLLTAEACRQRPE